MKTRYVIALTVVAQCAVGEILSRVMPESDDIKKMKSDFEDKSTVIFNDGIKFGRMLQAHDKRPL